jgi:hypothetical protein
MGRRCWVVVLAVAFIVPVAGATAAARETGSVPSKLVGTWNRKVTQANYDKYKLGQQGFLVGVWTMAVGKSGQFGFYTPGSYKPGCAAKQTCFYDFTVTGTAKGGRLILSSSDARICTGKVTYSWKASGKSLTLKVISETAKACTPYEALLEGVWKQTRT